MSRALGVPSHEFRKVAKVVEKECVYISMGYAYVEGTVVMVQGVNGATPLKELRGEGSPFSSEELNEVLRTLRNRFGEEIA